MKIKKIYIILLSIAVLLVLIIFALPKFFEYYTFKDTIFWDENVQIELFDYEAPVSPDSKRDVSYFHAFYVIGNDVQRARSKSFFDKSKSWARKDTMNYKFSKENELQLLRFDLFEVYSRKFNYKIQELRKNKGAEMDDLYRIGDSLYIEVNKEVDTILNSNISIDEKLKIWRPKVDQMLIDSEK